MEKEIKTIVQHKLGVGHKHPLVFNGEERSDKSKDARCTACLESLSDRPGIGCGECEVYFHKSCAKAPVAISHSPFHRKHPTLTLEASTTFSCDLCEEKNNKMAYYECTYCYFSLDIKCALRLHNIDEDFRELRYVGHQHSLTKLDQLPTETDYCHWCQKPVIEDHSVYACLDCRFYLHKQCAHQFPTQISHPCDRKHHLHLEADEKKLVCFQCQRVHRGFFYRCLPCELDIDIQCVRSRPRSFIESDHSHSFTLYMRPDPFICDACGTGGNNSFYICSACCIMIHRKCSSLPRIVRITRHHHYMLHRYYCIRNMDDSLSLSCGVCLGEVKTEYGSFRCLKPDCNYVAHVNCALEEGKYDVIDHVTNEEEDESFTAGSAITRVIERNQHGEATKIKHINHEHDLILGNEEEEDDGEICDACVLPISTSFYYYCSQCEFLVHKTCAELPIKKHHWFHRHLTTLASIDGFTYCCQCGRICSGFVYKSDYEEFCLRCVAIPHTLVLSSKGTAHKHRLFFDFKFRGECNACGDSLLYGNGAFRCKDCTTTFAVCGGCITLPQASRCKCDKHLLQLTYVDENGDPEQHYCDICEEKRNPNHWFYHCAICDNSLHPNCVLGGRHAFIKNGTTVPRRWHYHHHDLILVKKSYGVCSECCRYIQGEEALECRVCDYICHWGCQWERNQ